MVLRFVVLYVSVFYFLNFSIIYISPFCFYLCFKTEETETEVQKDLKKLAQDYIASK